MTHPADKNKKWQVLREEDYIGMQMKKRERERGSPKARERREASKRTAQIRMIDTERNDGQSLDITEKMTSGGEEATRSEKQV